MVFVSISLLGFAFLIFSSSSFEIFIFVPAKTVTPASTIQPSPSGIPVTEFAPSKLFSPIEIGFPSVPLKTPKMLAPPQHLSHFQQQQMN